MLATLPSEVLDMIVGHIASRQDLKQLCEVSTRLRDLAVPRLYQSLIISAPELSLEDLAAVLKTIPWKYLMYTKELGFSVPIRERVASRCLHCDDIGHFVDEPAEDGLAGSLLDDGDMEYESSENEDTDEATDKGRTIDPFFNLSRALDSLRLADNQLRSFRWEVGTCIPEALLCSNNNSFLGNQKQMRSITLMTDGECGMNLDTRSSVDLVQFRELQSLDWRGLNRYDDFESVRECIKVHGHQIQSLTLDLLTWDRAEEIWANGFSQQNSQRARIPDNFFSQRVLDVRPGDQSVIFSSLKNLNLSAVSFYHTGMETASAFNIERLETLKLRNCPGSLDWLQMILNSGKTMKLKFLELGFDYDSFRRDAHLRITEIVCNLIRDVAGLESLYLMLPEPIDWTTLTDRTSNHLRLQRFVMHHLVDRGGQNLIDGDIPWSPQLERILQERQLACFGSSIPPGELTRHFQRMRPIPLCQLIHVRISGIVLGRLVASNQTSWFSSSLYNYNYGDDLPYKREEIYNFARWAFGPDGLPNLRVLACGDFSHGGRYSKFNLLLCRSDTGYQPLTRSDVLSWNLVQDNMDMLAACPSDDILE